MIVFTRQGPLIRGSEDHQGKPARMRALAGTGAEPLRHLDFLIREPERSVLLYGGGVPVTVPRAEAFAVHKLIVAASPTQATFEEYVERFNRQRERFARMIFAVHSPKGKLAPPPGHPIQMWTGEKIAELAVRLGLGDWIAKRV